MKSMTGRVFQKAIIRESLGGITKIVPLIHRMCFSGPYSYTEIKERLGALKITKDKQTKTYQINAFCQLIQKKLRIQTNPCAGYYPKCLIKITGLDYETMRFINETLPGLKISSVEYAIDFFCKNSDSVSDLMYLLRRYCYFPYAKSTGILGDFDGWREPRESNIVYKINEDNKNNKSKYRKIYERGDDDLKKILPTGKRGWEHGDVDRVRYEITLKSKGDKLKACNIEVLEKLLNNPNFEQVFFPDKGFDEIQFKNFTGNKILPSDWEDYNSQDSKGNIECFQNEFIKGKASGINVSRFLEDSKALNRFKEQIKEALKREDRAWHKKRN